MKSHLVEMLNKAIIIIIIIIIIVIIICCCSLLIIAIKLRLFTTLRNMQFTQDGATERNELPYDCSNEYMSFETGNC